MTENEAVKIMAGHALANLAVFTRDVVGIAGLTYDARTKVLDEVLRVARGLDTQWSIDYPQAYLMLTSHTHEVFGE